MSNEQLYKRLLVELIRQGELIKENRSLEAQLEVRAGHLKTQSIINQRRLKELEEIKMQLEHRNISYNHLLIKHLELEAKLEGLYEPK